MVNILFIPLQQISCKKIYKKMKKVNLFFSDLLLGILFLATTISCSSDEIDLRKASVIAQDFVEERMGECDFDDLDYRGEKSSTPNRFLVFQKFTHDGKQYVYRINIQYNGGEWEDKKNWSYGELMVENTMTGSQLSFNGTLNDEGEKEPETSSFVPRKITAGGIEFNIIEDNGKAIRVYTKEKLSIKQVKSAVRELYTTYEIIQFAKHPMIARGQEYCAYQYKQILDFDNDNVIKFDPSKN